MSKYSEMIGSQFEGVDTRKREVTGKIVGIDPKPFGHPHGFYLVVKPDNANHDELNKGAYAYIDVNTLQA